MGSARECVALILAEVEAGAGAEQRQHVAESGSGFFGNRLGRVLAVDIGAARIADQRLGHGRGRQHVIGCARRDRMARHAVELRDRRVLRDAHPAGELDVLDAGGAVAPRAAQHHRDGLGFLVLGERGEEAVDRMALAARLGRLAQPQDAVLDRQRLRGDDDMDTVGLDPHAVGDLDDRHHRLLAEQLGEQAFARRLEMLDNDEAHAAVGRHRVQELGRDLQPAGRHADADDRERPALALFRIDRASVGRRGPLLAWLAFGFGVTGQTPILPSRDTRPTAGLRATGRLAPAPAHGKQVFQCVQAN